jgi:amino acid transporter
MIDLYTYTQLVSFSIFTLIIGFCLGNIFQILIRKYKIKIQKNEECN